MTEIMVWSLLFRYKIRFTGRASEVSDQYYPVKKQNKKQCIGAAKKLSRTLTMLCSRAAMKRFPILGNYRVACFNIVTAACNRNGELF